MDGGGGEKKRRLPSEEMRTVASFSTVSSSPSTSVAYRKEHKGCLGIKNRPSQLVRSASSLFFPLYIYNHTTIPLPPPTKKNVFPLKYYHPFPYSSEGGDRFMASMIGTRWRDNQRVRSYSPWDRNAMFGGGGGARPAPSADPLSQL